MEMNFTTLRVEYSLLLVYGSPVQSMHPLMYPTPVSIPVFVCVLYFATATKQCELPAAKGDVAQVVFLFAAVHCSNIDFLPIQMPEHTPGPMN